jgi:hypothetical protein
VLFPKDYSFVLLSQIIKHTGAAVSENLQHTKSKNYAEFFSEAILKLFDQILMKKPLQKQGPE